jgi:6-phosphogluconolactonase
MSDALINYLSPVIQAKELAKLVADELSRAIEQNGRATLAVPGGKTPNLFLMKLSYADIEWSKVTVTLTDERWVPIESGRSNFALLCNTLKQNNAVQAKFLPLYRDYETPEEALDELEQEITPHLPVDVCVVGMGEDMHTASFFPNANGLEQAISTKNTHALASVRPKDTDEIRITLTAPVFNAAKHHHVLIIGKNKRKALEKAKESNSVSKAPIRLILLQNSTLIHYAS